MRADFAERELDFAEYMALAFILYFRRIEKERATSEQSALEPEQSTANKRRTEVYWTRKHSRGAIKRDGIYQVQRTMHQDIF